MEKAETVRKIPKENRLVTYEIDGKRVLAVLENAEGQSWAVTNFDTTPGFPATGFTSKDLSGRNIEKCNFVLGDIANALGTKKAELVRDGKMLQTGVSKIMKRKVVDMLK